MEFEASLYYPIAYRFWGVLLASLFKQAIVYGVGKSNSHQARAVSALDRSMQEIKKESVAQMRIIAGAGTKSEKAPAKVASCSPKA